MARKKGSTTKKKCWSIRVIQNEVEVFSKQYSTLTEASEDLGMSYCQLFELAPNGRNKKKKKKSKFAPEIIVEKISNYNLITLPPLSLPDPEELTSGETPLDRDEQSSTLIIGEQRLPLTTPQVLLHPPK